MFVVRHPVTVMSGLTAAIRSSTVGVGRPTAAIGYWQVVAGKLITTLRISCSVCADPVAPENPK